MFTGIFSILFILAGVMSYIPGLAVEGKALGFFQVNNWIYIMSGAVGLLALLKPYFSIFYFRVIGILYIVLVLFGFATGHLYFMSIGLPDNILNLIIGLFALYLGFFFKETHL